MPAGPYQATKLQMTSILYLLCTVFALASVHAVAQAPTSQPVKDIHLTSAREIADATAVHNSINVMVKNVESCSLSSAPEAQPCACRFPKDLNKLKKAYEYAVAKHPKWNAAGSVVSFINPVDGKSVIINFPGLQSQLQACAKP